MIIDVHTHIFIKEAFKVKERYRKFVPKIITDKNGQKYQVIEGNIYGPITEHLYDVTRRFPDMKKKKIDFQVLSVVPFTFYYSIEQDAGLYFSRIQNDAIAALVDKFPDRFVGLATVPLQNGSIAAEELKRAVCDLNMKGVEIGSNVNGIYLDDQSLYPVYNEAQRLAVPIFVHPINVIGQERMQKYYLSNLIGNPAETSLAVANIIFGGIIEKFPDLKIIFAHAGGFIPYQRGRLEHGYHVRTETKSIISKPPSEYLKKLYFDTITHFTPALEYLIKVFGSDNILLGSDYPYDMGDQDPLQSIMNLKEINRKTKEKIIGKNAADLFKVKI